ncbi:sensor histidine kinase [Anaerosporobacter faecicola]|uniref:sensor histidine kinase n=1 Tax=Anaerosporobacter faecicola TaxID=2718714 RepID=UPI0014388B22|nr:ATP-binding protein [Anaerosporobacter faecicola]
MDTILENVPIQLMGIMLGFDENGTVVLCSPKAMVEFGYEETEEVTIYQLFPCFEGKSIEKIGASLCNYDGNEVAYRKNQTCFFSHISMVEWKKDSVHYLCTIENLENKQKLEKEVKQTEKKLEDALQAKSELVANVTHELRTPVNGIKGQINYLLEQTSLDEEQTKTLQIVNQCCLNMEKIINNLLDFSKMEAGKFTLSIGEFSLRNTVQQAIDTNIRQANAKGISLSAHISEHIPDRLFGDPLRIGQILNNLLSNGVKFTHFGSVRLEVDKISSTGNKIELFFMVIDTGIGIAQENKDKLFKSFSQVDGSITRKYGGTGLGLAVTKELVNMMYGNIWVESEAGKGSTFAFTIFVQTDEQKTETVEITSRLGFPQLIASRVQEENSIVYQWGSKENSQEFKKNMEKLILCIEMGNWERAETIAKVVKDLAKGADMEIIKQIFKLEMTIRREDYERSVSEYEKVKKMLPTLEKEE